MEALKTPIAEILKLLLDRDWHEVYDAHCKYRLSAIEIYGSLNRLTTLGLIEVQDARMRISPSLDEVGASLINRMLKTSRPVKLREFVKTPRQRSGL